MNPGGHSLNFPSPWIALVAGALATGPVGAQDQKSPTRYARELELHVKGNRAEAVGDLIGQMAGAADPRVAVLLPAAGTALASAENYEAALKAVVEIREEPAVQALVGSLEKPKTDYRQKILILEAFGRREDRATLEAIIGELAERVIHVKVAAIRACRVRRERECIAPLLDLLEKHWKARDRAWAEVYEALITLTGHDFESVEDWRKFVTTIPEAFDPKQVGKQTGPTSIKPKTTEDREALRFFGSEIFSSNLIFVIDVSGSMYMYDKSPDYKGRKVEEERQRLRRAKEQLTLAVKKLPRGSYFNIITFSDRVLSWQKQLQPANPANVASALKFVNDFKAEGATHTGEALEMAFKDLSVDTIVLLSDGAPMYKRDDDPKVLTAKILSRVKDLNAARKVTIHAFGFDSPGTWPEKVPWARGGPLPEPPTAEELKVLVSFLTTLAGESGGTFQAIK